MTDLLLVEGEETIIKQSLPSSQLNLHFVLKEEIKSRTLPPIDLTKLDGNPSKWPKFIDNFKTCVHNKAIFTDSVRIERLISVSEGNMKKAICSIGTQSTFYATALKTLKRDFRNPVVVAHLKIKSLFDAPQIYANDRVGLRQFHQQLKCCLTWFKSMGYSAAIESTENLTKAVMCLPNQLRKSFYKLAKNYNFLNSNVTLIEFEHWLENRVKE